MKKLIFSALIFSGIFSYAGGSQVGTLKTAPAEQSNTIFIRDLSQIKQGTQKRAIYTVEKKDGITEIAIANAVGTNWEIQKYAVPDSAIDNSEFSQLIDKSTSLKEWVELQK